MDGDHVPVDCGVCVKVLCGGLASQEANAKIWPETRRGWDGVGAGRQINSRAFPTHSGKLMWGLWWGKLKKPVKFVVTLPGALLMSYWDSV